ncbi:MAG: hypothetical protein DWP97_13675 [Calditrichaeota bacterium]|nr:MAG: hypothetical protein DWP97_13675 [Calditrichota bacterium]
MKLKIFLILILLFISSCDKPTEPNKTDFTNFRYPLEVGNKWAYQVSDVFTNIRSNTDNVELPIFNGKYFVSVLQYDLGVYDYGLNEPGAFFVQSRLDRYDADTLLHTYSRSGYFCNTNDGLFNFGGTLVGDFSLSQIYHNEEFHTKLRKNNASVWFNIFQNMEYPIILGKTWKYSDTSFALDNVEKKISDYKWITTQGGNQYCFVITSNYLDQPNYKIYDYYSEIGLVKKRIIALDINIYDENFDVIGLMDLERIYTLSSFTQSKGK